MLNIRAYGNDDLPLYTQTYKSLTFYLLNAQRAMHTFPAPVLVGYLWEKEN